MVLQTSSILISRSENVLPLGRLSVDFIFNWIPPTLQGAQ